MELMREDDFNLRGKPAIDRSLPGRCWPRRTAKEFAMLRAPLSPPKSLRSAVLAIAATALLSGPAMATPARAIVGSPAASAAFRSDGVVRIRSNHSVAQTVERVKAAVAAKGVRLFDAIDQAQLGAGANIAIRPSTLILFGNPPLGVQFLQSNPYAGLDWPVRMLVVEEADGSVWLAWSDFAFIAKRYGIGDKAAQFKMASEVAAAIAAEAAK
jgi:uncharacterized protein (DUF302 family)